MSLRGIDISGWQPDIDPGKTNADFVIVKATQGDNYLNPKFHNQCSATLYSKKLLGIYHFADGSPSAVAEADFFVDAAKGYLGKAVLVLDWEGEAMAKGPSYAEVFLDRVRQRTGITPWIYMSKSVARQYNWSRVAKTYPLWYAQYASYDITGWQTDPWTDSYGTGPWPRATAFQYTSSGRIAGYSGNLDLNIFYGTVEDWNRMAGTNGGGSVAKKVNCANVAAIIHADMCNDERNGYSYRPRTGGDHPDGVKKLVIDGLEYSYPLGSWDCSSSVCKAWQEAIKYTPYKGKLDGATYTGNMRSVFAASGLFDIWNTDTSTAQRGDVYLNDSMHTAMCQSPDPDTLSEFSSNEHGGAYGGQVGDQTGWESHITDYYDYPWNVTLHYNGKADFEVEGDDDMPFCFAFQPDERNEIWFFSGSTVTRLTHVDQLNAIRDNYKKVVGKDLPMYKLGTKKAPWGARFAQSFENRPARMGALDDEYKMNGWKV